MPDVEPGHAVKAELKSSEMLPTLSFGYESDKKKSDQAQETAQETNTQDVKGSGSSEDSKPPSPSSSLLTTSPSHAADTARPGSQSTSTALSITPRPIPIPAPSPLPIPRIVLTPTAPPLQAVRPVRPPSNIPIWLDALILGLGGILIALVIRKLL